MRPLGWIKVELEHAQNHIIFTTFSWHDVVLFKAKHFSFGPSRLFHTFWPESIGRWAENERSPRKKLGHRQAELGLSHIWPEQGSYPQWWDDKWFGALKISCLNHSAMGAAFKAKHENKSPLIYFLGSIEKVDEQKPVYKTFNEECWCSAWSPDGSYFAYSQGGGIVYLLPWDYVNDRL